MQTTTDTTETAVLYITSGETTSSEARNRLGLEDQQVRLSVATSRAEMDTLLDETTDCVLLGSQERDVVALIQEIRESFQSVPIIVFRAETASPAVTELLDIHGTDVIQSSPATTPPALIQKRIESVLNREGSRSGPVLDHHETILGTAADAIFQLDADGRIVSVNDAAVALLGQDRADLVGTDPTEYLDEEAASEAANHIVDLLGSDEEFRTMQTEVQTADGDTVPVEARLAVCTTDGELFETVVIARDITDKRERQKELEERDEMFRHIGENLSDVVWINGPDGGIEFVSAAYAEVWGEPRKKLYNEPDAFKRRIHPDDRQRVMQALEEKWEDPDSYDEIYRVVQPDGEIRWVHDSGFGVYEDGELQRIVGIAQDITDHKKREEELERKRDFLKQTQHVANIGGWEVDFETGTQRWTDEVFHIHELPVGDAPPPEEAIEYYHQEDRAKIRSAFDRLKTEGEPYDLELRMRTETDEVRWVRTWGKPLYDDRDIVGARGVFTDIHERKQRERELQGERDLIKRILTTSPIGVVVHDSDGQIVRVNEQASELLELDHRTLKGNDYEPPEIQLLAKDGTPLEETEIPFRKIEQTGEPVHGKELRVEKPSGERIVLSVDGVPLFENGELQRVVITLDDVTDRVERERKLTDQRNELAQLDRINRIIRDVDEALVGATSRQEIEQAVCDELSASGRYLHTMAIKPVGDGRLELQASCEPGPEYLEPLFPMTGMDAESSPGLRALETGNIQTIWDLHSPSEFPEQEWIDALQNSPIRSVAAIPVQYEGQEYGAIAVTVTEDNPFSERELAVLEELGETVGYAIAAVESREREATLTALYEATQDLLTVDSTESVCEVVVNRAAEVLEPPGIGIFLFEDDRNVLRPAAATDELLAFYGESTVFGPGRDDSVAWQTYVSGEEKVFTDITESDHVANPETQARSTLMLPLGEHGVFVVASRERGTFDEQKRRLIGLLATTTEAALDRVAGRAGIKQRDEQLQRRTARLEQYQRMFSVIERIDDLLRHAGTREEIERGVCQQLVELDEYAFAWIGSAPPDENTVSPRAWAGRERGYLDGVSLAFDRGEPAAAAARDGENLVVENVTDHLRDSKWAREAVDRDYQSVMSIPLVYSDTTYGVLTVYADKLDAFDDIVTQVLAGLGDTIAHSINSVETQRGILAEQVTELELSIDTPDTFLNGVASVTEESVSYREIKPENDGQADVLFALTDPPVEDVLALEKEYVAVESLTHIEQGGEHRFRAKLAGPTVAATLLDCGSIPKDVVASPEETKALVRLPRELDVRVYLDRVRESYPDTELVSRQDVERSGGRLENVRVALDEKLTDRQREVLVTAYESGFFESPRDTTGSELADLLGISQPTVTHHLREAQRRLFTSLFED